MLVVALCGCATVCSYSVAVGIVMDQSFVDPCMSQIGETLDEERRHGFVFPIPGGAIEQFPTLVKDALFSLNRLAGTKFNDARQLFHRPLTAVQKQAVSIACDSVNEAGSCPTMTGREALLDMMKAHPTYMGSPATLRLLIARN